MSNKNIPAIILGRLPLYLRSLQRMFREGRSLTSSQELGERLNISAAQIRKDLSQFGEFGKQGAGYNIPYLIEQLERILNVNHDWDIAIIGAGDMGSAVARYKGFTNRGFKVKIIFDSDPNKIGAQIGDFIIQDSAHMVESIHNAGIKIAVITAPAQQAQNIAEKLVKAGIRAILCYAPISLNVPPGIYVQYIDPSVNLQRMTYYIE